MMVLGAVRGLFTAGNSSHQSVNSQVDPRAVILLIVGFACLAVPLEIRQVAFVIVGAAIYASLQAANSPTGHPAAQTAAFTAAPSGVGSFKDRSEALAAESLDTSLWQDDEIRFATGSSSSAAPTTQWEKEVAALLGQLVPTPEAEAAVQQLARGVKHALRRLVPEAEVSAVATGDLARGGVGSAMAAPEVDVVVSAAPEVLMTRLQGRLPGRGGSAAAAAAAAAQQDELKLQKSAIRACVDRLVSSGGFKFRRSAFRGQEPKVTLLAPASLGFYSEAIPLDFSVNASTPLYNAALLSECGRMDPRAKDLILLVKRWAKDRGVCHTAKGHLSPYAWSLLTIYFLQVSSADGGPLLPPLDGLQLSSGLAVPRRGEMPPEAQAASVAAAARAVAHTQATDAVRAFLTQGAAASVAQLFRDFIRFYDKEFEWQKEAVSVRLGQRAPPEDTLPIFMIPVEGNGEMPEAGPSIEDPFNPRRNLGDCMTMLSFRRLKEELKRAEACSARDAPLAELMQPWAPPEREVPVVERDGGEDEASSENKAKSAEIAAAIAQLPRGPTRQVDFTELARSIGPPPGLDLPQVAGTAMPTWR